MHDPCTFNFDTPEPPSSFGISIFCVYMTCFFGMIFYHQINHQYVIASAHVIMMCMIVCTLQSMYTEYSDGALCAKTQFQGLGFSVVKPIRDILLDFDKVLHYASFKYITDYPLLSWIKKCEQVYNITFIFQLFYHLQIHKTMQQIYAQKFTQKHKAKESLYNLIYIFVIANLLWAIPCFIASIQWLQNIVMNILKFNFFIMLIKHTIYAKIDEFWWKQLDWLPKPANSSSNHTAGLLTGDKAIQAFLMNHKHTEFVYINAHYNTTPPTTFIQQETWGKGARMEGLVNTLANHCTYKDGTKINLANFRKFMQEKHKIYSEKPTLSSVNPVSAFAKDVLLKMKIQNKPT